MGSPWTGGECFVHHANSVTSVIHDFDVMLDKYLKVTSQLESIKYVYIIDQARGQDGWILAEFSFCVFMDRDEVEVHNNAKRERGQYPAILTELASSIKDLLYGIKSTEKNDVRTCLFSSTEKETS